MAHEQIHVHVGVIELPPLRRRIFDDHDRIALLGAPIAMAPQRDVHTSGTS